MIRSLRWRLQAWQALILLLAIAGFGSVLYLEIRRARFDEIDAELIAAARVLEGSLRALPPPVLHGAEFPEPPPDRPPLKRERLERALDLPKGLQHRYSDIHTPPWFVIYRSNGSVLKASET